MKGRSRRAGHRLVAIIVNAGDWEGAPTPISKSIARGAAAALVALPLVAQAKELKYNMYQPGTHQVTKNTVAFGEMPGRETSGAMCALSCAQPTRRPA
jgi:hypothetical protein